MADNVERNDVTQKMTVEDIMGTFAQTAALDAAAAASGHTGEEEEEEEPEGVEEDEEGSGEDETEDVEEESDEEEEEEEPDGTPDASDKAGEEGADDGDDAGDPLADPELTTAQRVATALKDLEISKLERAAADRAGSPDQPKPPPLKTPVVPVQPQVQGQDDFPEIPTDPKAARYDIPIPDALMQLIADPEKSKAGLEHLVSGVATLVERQTLSRVPGIVQQVLAELIPQMQQQEKTAQTTAQDVRTAFYGAYPGWDTEEFRLVTQAVAENVLAEENTKTWSASIQLKVAAKMRELTQTTGKAAPVKPKKKAKVAKRGKGRRKGKIPPKITTKTSARRNPSTQQGSVADGNSVNDIRALLRG